MKFAKNIFIILIASILYLNPCFSQIAKSNILLTVVVKCIDSEYVMIPQLKVLDESKIQIHKKLIYGNERDVVADCRFFLQKLVGIYYENIYIFSLKQPLYDADLYKLKNFSRDDFLNDTIYLQNYIPLEVDKYRLYIEFDYYKQKKKNTLYSNFFDFDVH